MSLDNKKDMLNKKCKKCKKGKYHGRRGWDWGEAEFYAHPLRCGNCDHETQRWVEKKKKKKKKLTRPFKETIIQRLLTDKKFKIGIEEAVIDTILEEDYYAAHLMLKDLVKYKERREETGG